MVLLVKRLPLRMLKETFHQQNAVTNAAHVTIAAHAHAPEEEEVVVPPLLTVLLKQLEPLPSLPIEESRTSTESLRMVKENLRPEITKRELKTPSLSSETRSLPTLIRLKLKMLLMTPRKKLTKSPLPRKLPMMLPPPPKRPPIKLRMPPRRLVMPRRKKRKRRRKRKRKKRRKEMRRKKKRKVKKRKTRRKPKRRKMRRKPKRKRQNE